MSDSPNDFQFDFQRGTLAEYNELQVRTMLKKEAGYLVVLTAIACAADIVSVDLGHAESQLMVAGSLILFFVIFLMAVLVHRPFFFRLVSGRLALVTFSGLSCGIVWLSNYLNPTFAQAVYLPIVFIGLAMFLVNIWDYVGLVLVSFFFFYLAQSRAPINSLSEEFWPSFNKLIVFIAIIMVPVMLRRLRTSENTFRFLKTIEEQKLNSIYTSKMSALGEMAAGVAHEVNNPLAVISGWARQISLNNKNPTEMSRQKIDESADKIQQMVARIAKIVSALRSFARDAQKDPFEKTEVAKIINETLELCRARLDNHGIKLTVNTHCEGQEIECRSVGICQVLLNLLNNSVDALEPLGEKWVEILTEDRGEFVEFSVTDSGAGIPNEIMQKIMQPFFTTKEVGKGTGLGLSISKGIVEDHGGRLYVDTSSPHTKFVMQLPKVQSALVAAS